MSDIQRIYKRQLENVKFIYPQINWELKKGRKHFLAKLINTETNEFRTVSLPSTKGTSDYSRFSAKLINDGIRDLGMKKLVVKQEMCISYCGLSSTW
jgi:hypothetical protein